VRHHIPLSRCFSICFRKTAPGLPPIFPPS
jgi:hypothetical protein